jgi:hypothetical protein
MPAQLSSSEMDLLSYLASPAHKAAAYPPLGGNAATPDKQ